jgi:ATP-binding protein involved in chromosome partitioning
MQRMEKGDIDHIVVIGSGKGGVGKSTVTSLIATSLRRRGLAVGVLDADITGASIPKLFGVRGPLLDRGEGIIPAVSADGISVVSSQFLLDDDPTPVVWRGPLVTRLILQFFGGVNWGHLDYLLIDMPPGTSDVPLTVFQSIPIEGMVFVLTPQELSSLIVRKAMNMARELHVPLLGVVENMAYFVCPHCHETTELFGPSAVPGVVKEYGVPLLGRLPIEPTISTLGDAGRAREFDSEALRAVTDAFLTTMAPPVRPTTL